MDALESKMDPRLRQMDPVRWYSRAMVDRSHPTALAPPASVPRGRVGRGLAAIGAAGGLLSGLLGVGGGTVMVPLLVLRAGFKQRDAHAVSLGAIIPISLASVITYGAAGKVRIGYAIALALGSVI